MQLTRAETVAIVETVAHPAVIVVVARSFAEQRRTLDSFMGQFQAYILSPH